MNINASRRVGGVPAPFRLCFVGVAATAWKYVTSSASSSASCASRERTLGKQRAEIEGEGIPRLANTSLIARIERACMNYAYASVCCVRCFATSPPANYSRRSRLDRNRR